MSTPWQRTAEDLAVLFLQAQSGLAGLDIVATSQDTSPGANRVACKAAERQPLLNGKDPLTTKAWRIPVEITLYLQEKSASNFDGYMAAIDAAFADGVSVPAAAATLATAQFPNCTVDFQEVPDSSLDHTEHVRQRMRQFDLIIIGTA